VLPGKGAGVVGKVYDTLCSRSVNQINGLIHRETLKGVAVLYGLAYKKNEPRQKTLDFNCFRNGIQVAKNITEINLWGVAFKS